MDSECWPWLGGTFHFGHGQFSIRNPRTSVPAQRVAYFIEHGIDPKELCVCHSCDNPACCNPAHLWLGTRSQNTLDRHNKGRTANGDATGRRKYPERFPVGDRINLSKLTEDQIKTIRTRRNDGEALLSIAKDFGVTDATVSKIARRQTWKHVA